MEKIKEVLKELGIEKREIEIYLTLIGEQDLTALQIAKKTKIDRTTTYDILEKLINKGMASSFIKNKTKHFRVLTPNNLLSYFKDKYYSLESIVPSLNDLSKKSKEFVSCELFQGKEGIKTVIKEFLETKANYKAIGIRKEYEEFLKFFTDQTILKINISRMKETAIVEKGSKFTETKNGTYRFINKKFLPPISTLIYKNIVVFFIWKEPYFAIRIENKDFAKLQDEYFNLLWKSAKK
ncbi:hypothetical protein CMI38_06485 [Candidatus Pacearchaeota archaeon]|nr:hypothetical protein [Candidatus Pacearchaeota archaeon]|tara:strand:+ start:1403 stop:2116 length:714 start_codon:yes stop_codon:yes gene_type:complete